MLVSARIDPFAGNEWDEGFTLVRGDTGTVVDVVGPVVFRHVGKHRQISDDAVEAQQAQPNEYLDDAHHGFQITQLGPRNQ